MLYDNTMPRVKGQYHRCNDKNLLLSFDEAPDKLVVGIDEVARGVLLGPVVAAAVLYDGDLPAHCCLNDSKKMTPQNREIVRKWIEANCLFGIGVVDEKTVDRINIQQAAYLAMHKALDQLGVTPDHILVDGSGFLPYRVDGQIVPYSCIPQGDGKFASIAAASVLAKQHHDALIQDLVMEHPELDTRYATGSNMGYGSPVHIEGIQKYGPSPFHRMSFAPAKYWNDGSTRI